MHGNHYAMIITKQAGIAGLVYKGNPNHARPEMHTLAPHALEKISLYNQEPVKVLKTL